ncbi:MAG: hypothetical protein PHE36_01440 [Novosphingobium sp.]|nr:hypothetical protein [Novosphingobium sp.]
MNQFTDFQADLISKVAAALGVDYVTMSKAYIPSPPYVPVHVLKLAASHDRRQVKRGVRLYFQINGKDAPRSYLTGLVAQLWVARRQSLAQRWANALYREWLAEVGQKLPTPQEQSHA